MQHASRGDEVASMRSYNNLQVITQWFYFLHYLVYNDQLNYQVTLSWQYELLERMQTSLQFRNPVTIHLKQSWFYNYFYYNRQ